MTSTELLAISTSSELETDRRRALRAILRHPLLPSGGETAEEYVVVRRHCNWLKQWLAKFPGWSLRIDNEAARLLKIPADLRDETRAAIDRTSGTAFTRRRYVLLCLALAALEQMDRQVSLSALTNAISEFATADRELRAAGFVFDTGNSDQRRDLTYAIRLLKDCGVLRVLEPDDSADPAYEINRHILAEMLQASHSPAAVESAILPSSPGGSVLERAARLLDSPIPPTEDARAQRLRSRLIRVLLDDPILYFSDLDDEERQYLDKHRGYLLRQICEATGLIPEVRAEGIALIDDECNLSDLPQPEEGMLDNLELRLVQWFAQCCRNGAGSTIPVSVIEDYVRHCSGGIGEAGVDALHNTLLQLRGLRLIELTDNGIVPLAACGRYGSESGNASDQE